MAHINSQPVSADKKFSRRDFLKLLGAAGAALAFPWPPPDFLHPPGDWLVKLKNQLGSDYSLERSNTVLNYNKPQSNRESLVFLRYSPQDTVVTFNVGADIEQPGVKLRETVRWADSRHLYPLFEELVAVDNQKRVYTFSEKSNRWIGSLGGNVIADYASSTDGSQIHIYVYDNEQNSKRVRSPFAVDIKTGDLVPAI